MLPRHLAATLALAPALLFGQLSPNSVTVTVSQAASVQPDQATFSVTVTSGFNKTLNDIVGSLSGLSITAANLVSIGSQGMVPAQPFLQAQPALLWAFLLTVPFSQQKTVTGSLTSLQSTIGQNNTGLALSYSVTGSQAAALSSENCNLAALVASARTEAQSLANAAGLGAGAIVGITSAVSDSLSPVCSLTVSFGLGATSWQPTLNTFTVAASQTVTPKPDQVTMVISVTSGSSSSLDDVASALQGAGVSGATFTGVNTPPAFPTNVSGLNWSFMLVVPLTKLNSTLTQITNAQQAIQQQSPGLSLTFYVAGLSSSQAQQSPPCPDASLVAQAQTQAQQVATAASLSLGPVLAMSGGRNPSASSSAVVVASGNLSAAIPAGSSISFVSLTSPIPPANPASACSIVVQYQLLY